MRIRVLMPAAMMCMAATAASAPAALAQDTPFSTPSGARPVLRADGTAIFNFGQYGLVFEGQIAPRVIILDSFGRATRNLLDEEDRTMWAYQLSATPMVRLRMIDQESSPVRTPSYMPKGTFQLARLRNLSTADPATDEKLYSQGPIEMWLLELIPFGHHSNGQENCLFLPRAANPGDPCVTPPPGAGQVNKLDGSFSTNYAELTIHYGRMRLDAAGAPEGDYASRREWRIGAGVQINPEGFAGGSISPVLAPRYGQTRVLVDAMTAWRRPARLKWFERFEIGGRLQYIGDVDGLPPVIGKVEILALPRRWGGAGIFVSYYGGQDYYNLGFAESIHRVHAGVALQRDTFLSVGARSMN